MARIVHLANMYSPVSGGLRTTVHALGETYLALGQDFTVIVPGQKFKKIKTSFGTKYEIPSIPIPFSGGYRLIIRTSIVKKLLLRISPDMIEISDRLTLLLLSHWARSVGFRTTVFAHERLDGVLTAYFGKFFPAAKAADLWNRFSARGIDNFVATTKYAAAEYERIGITTNIIPLGVDIDRFSSDFYSDFVRKEFQVEQILVLGMTRLSKEKDPQFLIEIAREIQKDNLRVKIVVLGDGPMRKSLEKTSTAEGLPICFLGHVSDRSRISSLLASADVFVAPGPIETFGLAALEALASGTPVVCRDTGAILEVIDFSCGSSEVRDATAWISRINQWANMNKGDSRILARKRAEQFSWHFCANSLLDLYGLASSDRKVA